LHKHSILRCMFIRNVTRTKCEVACDTCNTTFIKYISQCGDLHFCCKECIRKAKEEGGKIFEKTKKTTLERFGTENVFKSPVIKEKIRSVLEERYGADNPLRCKVISDKVKRTCIEKYGVDNPAKSQQVKDKESETYKRKSIEEKTSILEKRVETNMTRYGVAYPMQIEEVKKNFDWSEVYRKSQETRRQTRTGSYSSKIENFVGETLKEIFGDEDVKTQVSVNNRWSIDFFISSLNVYLQVDGVYWHGLNRPHELIRESKSSKDARILKTYVKDREQDEWAEQSGIRLVRITDEDINTWQKKNELKMMILQRLSQKTA